MADPSSGVAERDTEENVSGVEVLVRRLVRDLAGQNRPQRERRLGEVDGVILDVEVDGVRCLLLRVPETSLPLSPRELEIARMVAKGYPNKTIASVLDISSWTVASHLRRVFSKLGVSSRAAMVARLLDDAAIADVRDGAPARRAAVERHPVKHQLPAPLAT
jgi:DNA-binding CsgD family transcriptional regulator